MKIKLNDIYTEGELTLIYGPASSGKTTLVTKIAYSEVLDGKAVLFVSTENELFIERLSGNDKVLKRIVIVPIRDYSVQHFLITKALSKIIREYGINVLVVDSITGLARGEENYAKATYMLKHQLASLLKEARAWKIPVILTSQVRAIIDEYEGYEASARSILEYWCSNIVRLSIIERGFREALIEKSSNPEVERKKFLFEIVGDGIVKLR